MNSPKFARHSKIFIPTINSILGYQFQRHHLANTILFVPEQIILNPDIFGTVITVSSYNNIMGCYEWLYHIDESPELWPLETLDSLNTVHSLAMPRDFQDVATTEITISKFDTCATGHTTGSTPIDGFWICKFCGNNLKPVVE